MNYVDLAFIALFIVAGLKGVFRGFILECFSLIGFFLGIFFAVRFASPITDQFFGGRDYQELISIGIFLVIFITISIAVNLVARLLKKAINFTMLGIPDKILGGIFGVFKWTLFASVVIWIFDSIGIAIPERLYEGSVIFPVVSAFAPIVFEYASVLFPWAKDLFDNVGGYNQNEKLV